MEPLRRDALIRAAIAEVGARGLLDVTVSRIARRAGVSPALAHHYFGSKDAILLAAMRRILEEFGASVRAHYRTADGPRARLEAVVEASFAPEQFAPEVVLAWLTFYVQAHHSPGARRLLAVYAGRLQSNLVHALRQLTDEAAARRIAQGIASMIDGLYIRAALQERAPDRHGAIALTRDYLDLCLSREGVR
jgi:TetR/AcrR family transcriptional regulator, transcriptional repressor of bet genes